MDYHLELETARYNLSGAKCTFRKQPYFPPMKPYKWLHVAAAIAAAFYPNGWVNAVIAIVEAVDPRREERRVRIPKLPRIR